MSNIVATPKTSKVLDHPNLSERKLLLTEAMNSLVAAIGNFGLTMDSCVLVINGRWLPSLEDIQKICINHDKDKPWQTFQDRWGN